MPSRPNWRERSAMRKYLMRCGNDVCPECGKPLDWTLDWYVDPRDGKRKRHPYSVEYDHVKPHARGGDNSVSNAQAMHRICNQRKGDGTRRARCTEVKRDQEPPRWSGDW